MIQMPVTVDGKEYMPLEEVLAYLGMRDRGTLKENYPELKHITLRVDRRRNYYLRADVEKARANPIGEPRKPKSKQNSNHHE